MGMIKLLSSGGWSVNSKTDPRWDGSGYTEACGGFVIPKEAQAHIEAKERELGEKPADLEWSYMKD